MKIRKNLYKKIIAALLAVIFLFCCNWIYRNWILFQRLIEEKGENMMERYHIQGSYLRNLEEITARIILTRESPEKMKEDIRWINEFYWGMVLMEGYNRYGYGKEKIEYRKIEEFIGISNRFLKSYSRNRLKFTDKNIDVLKKINRKARELNSISNKYYNSIEEIEMEDLFYSDVLAKAVNEMNSSLGDHLEKDLDYEIEYNRENEKGEPSFKDIYGSKTLSEDEAKKIAKQFLGKDDFGEIIKISYKDDKDMVLRSFYLRTENGYRLEIFGEKIVELEYRKRGQGEAVGIFEKLEVNMSKEEVAKELMDFLSVRGFDSLEIIELEELGEELDIEFAEYVNGYINMAARINGRVNLAQEKGALELDFSEYWKGLLYDASGYDTAFKGYEKAKAILKQGIVIKEEKLVGHSGKGFTLDFNWRFTTEFDGEDYYIFVNPVAGEVKDVCRVYK